MNPLVVLLIVLVVSFFLLILSASYDYVPYNSTKTNYARYEPMSEIQSESKPVKKEEKEEKNGKEEKPEKKSLTSSLFSSLVNSENFEPIVDVAQTIQYGPLRDSEIIDKFSQVKNNGVDGVDGCVSSGLSNSGGSLCLTPELIKLLKTRGGNASGNDTI